mgnify:CR=1 FL=1
MADVKISELSTGTASGDDKIAIVDSGGTKIIDLNALSAFLRSNGWDVTGNIDLADNGKLLFGAGDDLQIYHNGTDSYIYDGGDGDLNIRGQSKVRVSNAVGANYFQGTNGAEARVYYNGSTKLATTSTGIDVTGTVTADGLESSGDAHIGAGNSKEPVIQSTNSGRVASNPAYSFNGDLDTGMFNPDIDNTIAFATGGSERLRINSSGNVGIGTSSPSGKITISSDAGVANQYINLVSTQSGSARSYSLGINSGDFRLFDLTANLERMRIDSSGHVLVGTTSSAPTTGSGFAVQNTGRVFASFDGGYTASLNRDTSDGEILRFRKDGSTVGSIGTLSGRTYMQGSGGSSSGLQFAPSQVVPFRNGTYADNQIDLGNIGSGRFDDIYATNGSIQTSDRNEKQDIEELSEAEQRVAVACKGLMRKFRWKDAVEEKGDDARIHFGIIAQDLQAAFEAEGLDAGRYAMFISTTWWEAERIIPAVEAVEEVLDEDGSVLTEAVEAVEEQTVTDTFDTLEEAPEGATERTRMGVRYTELLAFIIGAI